MRKILKQNQIVISVIALMLIAVGYMSYTVNSGETIKTSSLVDTEKYGDLGDATLVSANTVQNTINTDTVNEENSANTIETASNEELNSVNEYYTNTKMERDNMYSEKKESCQKILENANCSDEQKELASEKIEQLNNEKNAIMIAENLIKNKGFDNIVILKNNDSINVIIKKDVLEQTEVSQIQNIIERELSAKSNNIHISCKN